MDDNLSKVNKPDINNVKVNKDGIKMDNLFAFLNKVSTRDPRARKPIDPKSIFTQIAYDSKYKTSDAEKILSIFPDADIAIELITSCILSPNDMKTINLIYNFPNISIPENTKQKINNFIKDYIDNVYKIEADLPDMIKQAKFLNGSYVTVIIPEASFDDVINKASLSYENYKHNNKKNKTSVLAEENFDVNQFIKSNNLKDKKIITSIESLFSKISIEDDYRQIKDKKAFFKQVSNEVYSKNRYTQSKEDSIVNIDSLFRPSKDFIKEETVIINDKTSASRKSIGKPLYFKVPSESIIPVYPKGEPNNHIGYFLLVDERGMPLSIDDNEMVLTNAASYGSIGQNIYGDPIDRVNDTIHGEKRDVIEYQDMETMFSAILEKMIKDKLKNGKYEDLVTTNKSFQINRIMFTRALESKETKLVFVPEEMVNYFAYEYRKNGTGCSIFEQIISLYTVRAILLFSRLIANMKNNIPIKQVDVKIPDDDPDPTGTFETVKDLVLSTRKNIIPFGMIDASSISEWLYKSSYEFKFNYNKLSDLSIDFADTTSDIKISDTEFEEQINALILNKFGLTPDMIKPAYEPEFATTILSRNLLLAKRNKKDQDITSYNISDLCKKIIKQDQTLSKGIEEIIREDIASIRKQLKNNQVDKEVDIENFTDEQIIDYIISTCEEEYTINLPEAQTTDAPAAFNAMKYKFETIEEIINGIFDSNMFGSDITGEIGNSVDSIKAIAIGYLKKKYIIENDMLPEITDLFIKSSDANPAFDDVKNSIEILFGNFMNFLTTKNKVINKLNDKYTKLNEDNEDNGDDNNDNYESDNNNNEDNIESDNMGDGDDDLDFDTGDNDNEESKDGDKDENEDEDYPVEETKEENDKDSKDKDENEDKKDKDKDDKKDDDKEKEK